MLRIPAVAFAMALGLLAGAAQAVTIQYRTNVSGENLGDVVIATLDVTENGSDLDFVLTNVLTAYPSSFVSSLGLDYVGGAASALSFGNISGKPVTISTDDTPPGGNPYNVLLKFVTSNAGGGAKRLKPETTTAFTVFGARLSDFDFALGETQLHMNATRNDESTKYTGTLPPGTPDIAPVPLPAPALLLVAGLAGLAGLRRRT